MYIFEKLYSLAIIFIWKMSNIPHTLSSYINIIIHGRISCFYELLKNWYDVFLQNSDKSWDTVRYSNFNLPTYLANISVYLP